MSDEVEIVDEPEPGTEVAVSTAAVAPRQAGGLVLPQATPAEVSKAVAAYKELCEAVLDNSDYQTFRGNSQRFKKKSAWRKLAVAFNVSVEQIEKHDERNEDGRIVQSEVRVRASAPNGRFVEGIGSCSIYEQRFHDDVADRSDHDIPATAFTRAYNRACSDLFGLGEVSAEEMQGQNDYSAEGGMETHRSRRSASDGSPKLATEKQLKMIGARLGDWRSRNEASGDKTVIPVGWAEAGLTKPKGEWTFTDVDTAVKMLEGNPAPERVNPESVTHAPGPLTKEELDERTAAGVCVGCGDKFTKTGKHAESKAYPGYGQSCEPF